VLEPGRRGVLALAESLEEVQLAWPGAGEDVTDAVAVEVHKLWSEADASAAGDFAGVVAGLEPLEFLELRLPGGARVAVDAELARAELAGEQLGFPLAEQVGKAGGSVADIDINRLVRRQHRHRRSQLWPGLRLLLRQGRQDRQQGGHRQQPSHKPSFGRAR